MNRHSKLPSLILHTFSTYNYGAGERRRGADMAYRTDVHFINATHPLFDYCSSYNIMVKAFPNAMQFARGDRRCALHPVRINIT
jgi:hypothetical protein